MTEFEKIIAAIKPFGFPHAPDIYEGSEEHFFVYNYADERADFYADNAPAAVRASVQVHLYVPAEENFIELKKQGAEGAASAGLYLSRGYGTERSEEASPRL